MDPDQTIRDLSFKLSIRLIRLRLSAAAAGLRSTRFRDWKDQLTPDSLIVKQKHMLLCRRLSRPRVVLPASSSIRTFHATTPKRFVPPMVLIGVRFFTLG